MTMTPPMTDEDIELAVVAARERLDPGQHLIVGGGIRQLAEAVLTLRERLAAAEEETAFRIEQARYLNGSLLNQKELIEKYEAERDEALKRLATAERERDAWKEMYESVEGARVKLMRALSAAWRATGVASTVSGLTTLDDVIITQRTERDEARAKAEAFAARNQDLVESISALMEERYVLRASLAEAEAKATPWVKLRAQVATLTAQRDQAVAEVKKTAAERDRYRTSFNFVQKELHRAGCDCDRDAAEYAVDPCLACKVAHAMTLGQFVGPELDDVGAHRKGP